MSEECIESGGSESKDRLICSGIWGGIRDQDQTISTDGLSASLYSSSCDGGKGGDYLLRRGLQALHEHTGDGLTHDDVTLIAMEVR